MQTELRVVTWNISCGVIDSGGGVAPGAAEYVGRTIRALGADVVGLQEVPLPGTAWHERFVESIATYAGMPNIAVMPLSESHLVEGANMGLAILSRLPIVETKPHKFATLDVTLRAEGKPLPVHPKGAMTSKIRLGDREINCLCAHLPPFHRLEQDPSNTVFHDLWTDLDKLLVEASSIPTVAVMDMNTATGSQLLPGARAASMLQFVHQPTRPTNELHDQIMCSVHWHRGAVRVLTSRFDHHLCLASISLQTEPIGAERAGVGSMVFAPASILHLSDLHFGAGSEEDVDWKTYVPFATREQRRDRLVQFIGALPKRPDYVIISGDLTIAGRDQGFQEFSSTIDDLIRAGRLPGVDKILVVPGNHDVRRQAGGHPADEVGRWRSFNEHTAKFVHPPVALEAGYGVALLERIRQQCADVAPIVGGSWDVVDVALGLHSRRSAPFVLDRVRGLLIYGFNSACVSGTKLRLASDVEEAVERLRKTTGSKFGPDIALTLKALDEHLWVDPSRVDEIEINLFNETMEILRAQIDGFGQYTKIAVLHHHVQPVIPEEVKSFESLLNAGRFRFELSQAGFDVILHGHKHWPRAQSTRDATSKQSLLVVSGGTIGGDTGAGREPGFFWLELGVDRDHVKTTFVPVPAAGNPGSIVKQALASPGVFPLKGLENPRIVASTTRPVRPVFDLAEAALLAHLRRDGLKGLVGWCHNLDENRVSVVATAYGLSILDLIEARTGQVRAIVSDSVESLLKLRNSDGGWSTSSQGTLSRPEPTAFVLDALSRWVDQASLEEGVSRLESLVEDPQEPCWASTYSISLVTRVLARLRSNSPCLAKCVAAITSSAYRDRDGNMLCWSKDLVRSASESSTDAGSKPSVLHTAHAVVALDAAARATGDTAGLTNLSRVQSWLLERSDWQNTSEDIYRPKSDGKYDKLVVKHYTTAWCVRALIALSVPLPNERLRRAVSLIGDSGEHGTWDWDGVRKPIWATYDALYAIKEYSLASLSD